MKLSVSVGDLAHGHDTDAAYRSKLPNVDPTRTARNVVLRDESVEQFYARRFGPAVEAYNARQRAAGRPGRCVGDYLEKVRSEYARDREAVREGHKRRSQKPAEAYEYVVQVGDARSHPDEATAGSVLREWLDEMEGRCPGMEVAWAAIHNDEATPHLHVAMVPVGEGKRGIGTTVSWNGALKRCNVRTKVELLAAMKDTLRERCAAHGIEVEPDGPGGRAHVTVEEYKRQMAAAEKAARDAKQARADAAQATQAKNEAERKAREAKAEAKKARDDAKQAQEAQGKAEKAARDATQAAKQAAWDTKKAQEAQGKAERAVTRLDTDITLKTGTLNQLKRDAALEQKRLDRLGPQVERLTTQREDLKREVEALKGEKTRLEGLVAVAREQACKVLWPLVRRVVRLVEERLDAFRRQPTPREIDDVAWGALVEASGERGREEQER